jgi:hypothetical protein
LAGFFLATFFFLMTFFFLVTFFLTGFLFAAVAMLEPSLQAASESDYAAIISTVSTQKGKN